MHIKRIFYWIGIEVTLSQSNNSSNLRLDLFEEAYRLGFDDIKITTTRLPETIVQNFDKFISDDAYGDMEWLGDTSAKRRNPTALWPDVKSIVTLAINYGPAENPMKLIGCPERGNISVYARGTDYHKVFKKRLKALARWLSDYSDSEQVKVFVDTAPVLEKPLAQMSGIGWQGKHTNLVSLKYGSWLFLGEIFTTLVIEPDQPVLDHCGSCTQCLNICPTSAFIDERKLDVNRCISYLTIEYKGHIDRELRPLMGNRIYGCDDCLAVCPWNKFAQQVDVSLFKNRVELEAPFLSDLVQLNDQDFRNVFSGSPIKRIGRDRFVRNVLIAIGNSRDEDLINVIVPLCSDPSSLVRAMAVWALSILAPRALHRRTPQLLNVEKDSAVRLELLHAQKHDHSLVE